MSIETDRIQRPISELSRYAGWLARNQPSAAVQKGVRALDEAVQAGHESSQLLLLVLTLDHDIKRLPGGAIPKMLRKTLGQIRAVIDPPSETDVLRGDRRGR